MPDVGASYVVLIGASRYAHLESLPAVAINLTALEQELAGPHSWGLRDGHRVVVREPDSATQVLDAVKYAAEKATDTLLVYYAGHGLQTEDGDLYLAVSGSVSQRGDTGLQYDHLRKMLLRSRAERHVVVLDCCFSGKAIGAMGGPAELVEQAEIEGSYVVTASPGYRQALAPPGDTYTACTAELLNLLRAGIPSGPPLLNLDSAYDHIRGALKAKGRPAPQKRGGNTAGQLALCRNRAFRDAPTRVGSGPGPDSRELIRGRIWPDPDGLRTAIGFINALSQVRVTSCMSHKDISAQPGGRIAPGTVSQLPNRTSLPSRWNGAHTFLSTCSVPENQVVKWKEAWERLRAEQRAEVVVEQPQEVSRPAEAAHLAIWKKLGWRARPDGRE